MGLGHSHSVGRGVTAGQNWGIFKEIPGCDRGVGATAAPAGAPSRRLARQGGVLVDVLTRVDEVGQSSLGSPWHYSRTGLCLSSLIPFLLQQTPEPSKNTAGESHLKSWWLAASPSAQAV